MQQKQTTQSTDIPKWSALLVEAVNKPGMIMKAYSAFWNYSVGNQILALIQCQLRGIQPGPINTFPKWQTLGRVVKRGEKGIFILAPMIGKKRSRDEEASSAEADQKDGQSYSDQCIAHVPLQIAKNRIAADRGTLKLNPVGPEMDAVRT